MAVRCDDRLLDASSLFLSVFWRALLQFDDDTRQRCLEVAVSGCLAVNSLTVRACLQLTAGVRNFDTVMAMLVSLDQFCNTNNLSQKMCGSCCKTLVAKLLMFHKCTIAMHNKLS